MYYQIAFLKTLFVVTNYTMNVINVTIQSLMKAKNEEVNGSNYEVEYSIHAPRCLNMTKYVVGDAILISSL